MREVREGGKNRWSKGRGRSEKVGEREGPEGVIE